MPELIGLLDIYDQDDLDDEEEMLFHHLWDDAESCTFEVMTIHPEDFGKIMTADSMSAVVDVFRDHATSEQNEMVRYKADNFDEDRIIVMKGSILLDGNHHLMAALQVDKPVRFIDLDLPIEPGPDMSH